MHKALRSIYLACNFVEKYLGTVHFGNDQFAPILGYGDLVQGNITIKRVYYVEGLNHNLFSVGQFCDADLEVAFWKSTCFVRDLQGNDLLTGNRGTDLYTISLQETTSSTPICLMAKAYLSIVMASRLFSSLSTTSLLSKKDVVIGLPKLKYVKDQLCSSCEVSKAKRSSFKSKTVPSSKGRLNLLHMDLCGPMRVASINGKKYILMEVKTTFLNGPLKEEVYVAQPDGFSADVKEAKTVLQHVFRRVIRGLSTSCASSMWMRTQLQDFGFKPTTKYRFIVTRSQPSLDHELRATRTTEYQLVDMFTKALPEDSSQAVNKSPTHYPCDSARTFRVILFSIHNDEWKSFQCHHQTALRSYTLSWKPCQGDSLNLPDHRIHKDGDGDASFQLKSDSLPHAHAQSTKTFYKHQDSRIMKAQELKTKTSAQTLIYKIFLQRYQVYQGRLLASFQDDAKYEHVGQDTRSQGGKDDQDGRIKV
ncbi:hypothetical protein Tco_0099499 [Tanacetum coccineum]